jgi:signal transduction histidine kinase
VPVITHRAAHHQGDACDDALVLLSRLRVSRREGRLVVAVAVALGVAAALVPEGPASVGGRIAAVGCAIVVAGSLLWMRRAPGWAMGMAIAGGVCLQALCPFIGSWGAATIALATLARTRPPRVSLRGLAAMAAVSPVYTIRGGRVDVVVAVCAAGLAWSWGEVGRRRHARREAEKRQAVVEERARIARELHDVVAHTVSMMVVQATAAEDGFDARPADAREALRTIAASGRAALSELRLLLHLVRPDLETDPRHPQPGLEQLDELAASMRAIGLAVSVRGEGVPVSLPVGVDMSAYRIVQEALTNTLRHAGAGHADVLIRYTPEAVEIEVEDDGDGGAVASETTEGRGIVGMRERASLLGGVLETGPGPRGGYRVRARLPLAAVS